MSLADPLVFKYNFHFENKEDIQFKIALDADTLNLITKPVKDTTGWARLDNEKCSNCPLDSKDYPNCPIAYNLTGVLPFFVDMYSFEAVKVTVRIAERVYAASTTVQQALASMMGIFMVTSKCPIMSKLKPMVRFHLPFASVEETIYRAASTYLLGQYFKYKKGETPDWDLTGLRQIYKDVQKVNIGMAARLRSLSEKDANLNALVELDVFAKEMPDNIQEELKMLAYLFE
ncbi:MAG: hypothetical protein JXR46_13755 [Calditrichaceae bacterium]|nr:hypothetical protein [Calditrichaceae bacterium]MBN2710101.1 hypothetical protein [Calditrichaceae bacterium]RQV94270.1 MAG: hypothetical protein EH224_10520 [Calditrichota bacterium]